MFKIKPSIHVDAMGEPIEVGDWKRKKELGSGGFGVVTLWMNDKTGDCIAIKKCKWNLESHLTEKQRKRWESEVKMMQDVRHQNIVNYQRMPIPLQKALLSANTSKLPILSMEYCSLGNLRTVLNNPENSCGLCECEVVEVLHDVSSAIKFLHSSDVTHRDIKPENIVLQKCHDRKSGIIYKIIDLGYAKELKSATVSFVGTLYYLAPEMFEKETYSKSVDYWSLGITAFEIICGIRPFLPTYTPALSYQYIKDKNPDEINIFLTHTGEIKASRELPKDNHINPCLKQYLEKWLRAVLQFSPEKRGLIENNNLDVFNSIQNILSKKIITVFSIYTYEFYYYEVDESTQLSTLQDWISRDTKIQKADQYLVAGKAGGIYAIDFYDENSRDAMLFIFKKRAGVNDRSSKSLPKFIKMLIESRRTEFKFGTLKLLYAQLIHFVFQEYRHLNALRNGLIQLGTSLNGGLATTSKLLVVVKSSLHCFLEEVEFYNMMLNQASTKWCNRKNNDLVVCLAEYITYTKQLQEVMDTFNAVANRYGNLMKKSRLLQGIFTTVLPDLNSSRFDEQYNKAMQCYTEVSLVPPRELRAKDEALQVVCSTLKMRDELLRKNEVLQNLLKSCTSFWCEMNKLSSCLRGMTSFTSSLKGKLRENHLKRLELLQKKDANATLMFERNGATKIDLEKENMAIRYRMEDFFDTNILKYKDSLESIQKLTGHSLESEV